MEAVGDKLWLTITGFVKIEVRGIGGDSGKDVDEGACEGEGSCEGEGACEGEDEGEGACEGEDEGEGVTMAVADIPLSTTLPS